MTKRELYERLTKNKEQLDVMINLDEEYKGEDVLFTNEEIEDIKSRECINKKETLRLHNYLDGLDQNKPIQEQFVL